MHKATIICKSMLLDKVICLLPEGIKKQTLPCANKLQFFVSEKTLISSQGRGAEEGS